MHFFSFIRHFPFFSTRFFIYSVFAADYINGPIDLFRYSWFLSTYSLLLLLIYFAGPNKSFDLTPTCHRVRVFQTPKITQGKRSDNKLIIHDPLAPKRTPPPGRKDAQRIVHDATMLYACLSFSIYPACSHIYVLLLLLSDGWMDGWITSQQGHDDACYRRANPNWSMLPPHPSAKLEK
jgi:hypothetical protein